MSIENAKLGITPTTLLYNNKKEEWSVLAIIFCNPSESPVTLSLYAAGGKDTPVTEDHLVFVDLILNSKDSYIWTSDERFIIGEKEVVAAKANVANIVTVTTSWIKVL